MRIEVMSSAAMRVAGGWAARLDARGSADSRVILAALRPTKIVCVSVSYGISKVEDALFRVTHGLFS